MRTPRPHRYRALFYYGLLALPLAFAALPVYVHAPKFYAGQRGIDLAVLGILLLLVRGMDAVLDPWIGGFCDLWNRTPASRPRIMAAAFLPLALGFLGLFHPPHWGGVMILFWFCACLIVIYLAFSTITIAYGALGNDIATNAHERTRVAAWREGLGLLGVLCAAALPSLLTQHWGEEKGFFYFSLIFMALLAITGSITYFWSPRPGGVTGPGEEGRTALHPYRMILECGRIAEFRTLAIIYLIYGTASAIPATLVLFYIEDVLRAPEWSGAFLAVYFLSGAAALPLWGALSRRYGKVQTWAVAMAFSMAAFIGAYWLEAGDVAAYCVVCVLSGACLGANLTLPVSLLGDMIAARSLAHRTASFFGIWNFLGKACLAFAAGTALPLLDHAGYVTGGAHSAMTLHALSALYALLPCGLICIAATLLWRARHRFPPTLFDGVAP